jgi:tRNA A37 methylthiotransferase MiaB
MHILLLSMPDYFEHMPPVAVRMPTGALSSLAGNVDDHHRVASRGCTYDCSFCSIITMRGRNCYTYSFERVLEDIRNARPHGARTIFLVGDNIALNVRRFEALCHAIIAAGLNTLVQTMALTIADHGDTLGPLMRRAG